MKHKFHLSCCLLALLVVTLSTSAKAGDYIFYEGNGGTQNIVCTLSSSAQSKVNFKNDSFGCDNDETRSVVLDTLPAGAMLTVYDDPDCTKNDDYTRIRLLEPLSGQLVVEGYESARLPSFVEFTHFHNNGLDGKVSCVQISVCGDGLCASGADESCSTCTEDCGPCSPGGGGGGGGEECGPQAIDCFPQ